MATTSCVLGVLSFVSTPLLGFSGFVLGLAAIVIGAAAIRQIRRGRAAGRARAIIGLVTGIVILVVGGGISVWFFGSRGFYDLPGGLTDTVPVTTRPRDEGQAKDLGGTIAKMGRCDTLEYGGDSSGVWRFVCDRWHDDPERFESFTIQVYGDSEAKHAEGAQLRAARFRYKEGPSFRVIAAKPEGRQRPWHALDGFPGTFPPHHP